MSERDSSEKPDPVDFEKTAKRIFLEALDLEEETERREWVAGACGESSSLLGRVEELLAADLQGDDGFDVAGDWRESIDAELEGMPVAGDSVTYFGDYELIDEIARGAMGVVFRARQVSLNRTVAVKMIRGSLVASESDVQRFRAEAEAAAGLDHPRIVPIYEVGEHEDQCYFSMKLIEGGTLADRLLESRMEPREAVRMMVEVARAVHAAHQRGVLHRDIKPGNILVDGAGEPWVTDFGLAKQIESESSLTLSGQILGTPFYMAPEQAGGEGRQVSTASDVYSLGAVLHEMLSGEPPFRGSSLVETLRLVQEESAPALRTQIPGFSRDLETIVLKCLEKDPDRRYSSAAALAEDLERWLRGEPIEARPVTAVEQTLKWMKRKPIYAGFWGVAAVLLLLLGIGGPIIAYRQMELKDEARQSEAKASAAQRLAEEREKTIRENLYFAEMNLAAQASREAEGLEVIQELTDHWARYPDQGEDLRGWEWYYLRSLLSLHRDELYRSPNWIRPMALSNDGKRLAFCCFLAGSQHLEFLDLTTGNSERVFIEVNQFVNDLAWSPDDKWIAFVSGKTGPSGEGEIRIFSTRDPEIERTLKRSNRNPVLSVAWNASGSRLATGDGHGEVSIWDLESGRPIWTDRPDRWIIYGVEFSPDGRLIASVDYSGQMLIRDAETGGVVRELAKGISRQLHRVRWNPDGTRIAAGGRDQIVRIWDTESWERVGELEGHNDAIFGLSWSPDGSKLATCSVDRTARIWDIDRMIESNWFRSQIPATPAGLASVAWSPDGRALYTAGEHIIERWDANQTGEARTIEGHASALRALSWDPEGKTVIARDEKNRVIGWHIDTLDRAFVLDGMAEQIEGISVVNINQQTAYSHGGHLIAFRITEGILILDSLNREKRSILKCKGHFQSSELAWSPDDRYLVSIRQGVLVAWEVESGHVLWRHQFPGPISPQRAVAWSPDGAMIAAGTNPVLLVNSKNGELIRTIQLGKGFNDLKWSPDGNQLAGACFDGGVYTWRCDFREPPKELKGHSGTVYAVDWSPDGRRLVSAGRDGTCRVWDVESRRQLLALRGHQGAVYSAAWSPDGRRIVSGGYDRSIKVWDAGPDYEVSTAKIVGKRNSKSGMPTKSRW